MPKTIPQKLRTIRKELSLSQQEVARKAHISQAALSGIESGESTPTLETLAAIAVALGVHLSDLFGEKYCPVCGFEYTHEAALESIAHKSMHSKAEAIAARYGFYWPYRYRKQETSMAQMILENEKSTGQARYNAALKLLKAYFSRSVQSYPGTNHPDFPQYAAMLLNNPALELPEDTRAQLVAEYGTLPGIEHGTYYHKDEQETQIDRISARLKYLPPDLLDAVELICNHGTPGK